MSATGEKEKQIEKTETIKLEVEESKEKNINKSDACNDDTSVSTLTFFY